MAEIFPQNKEQEICRLQNEGKKQLCCVTERVTFLFLFRFISAFFRALDAVDPNGPDGRPVVCRRYLLCDLHRKTIVFLWKMCYNRPIL